MTAVMNAFWLLLAQADEVESDGDGVFGLIVLGIYALIGLAFVVGIIWAIFSRQSREKRQERFEDRDN